MDIYHKLISLCMDNPRQMRIIHKLILESLNDNKSGFDITGNYLIIEKAFYKTWKKHPIKSFIYMRGYRKDFQKVMRYWRELLIYDNLPLNQSSDI